jgi:hypothetical protein
MFSLVLWFIIENEKRKAVAYVKAMIEALQLQRRMANM